MAITMKISCFLGCKAVLCGTYCLWLQVRSVKWAWQTVPRIQGDVERVEEAVTL
jgi:hypothetical protein